MKINTECSRWDLIMAGKVTKNFVTSVSPDPNEVLNFFKLLITFYYASLYLMS